MGNKDRRDFVTEEHAYVVVARSVSAVHTIQSHPRTRHTGSTVMYLYTFVRIACLARREVTLKVWGAILARVDDLAI
jgi:hypothetical protein